MKAVIDHLSMRVVNWTYFTFVYTFSFRTQATDIISLTDIYDILVWKSLDIKYIHFCGMINEFESLRDFYLYTSVVQKVKEMRIPYYKIYTNSTRSL